MAEQTRSIVNIADLLDGGPFTPFQVAVVALAATAVMLDGVSSQLIGFAIPSIAREWALKPGAFAPAVAAGLFGMSIGSVAAGICADRVGRRWVLIACVLFFGIANCASALATGVTSLSVLRFLGSLGIGGAIPLAATLTAEFTPLCHRTLAVTATVVCTPLGGIVVGVLATNFLPLRGWRALFFAGGAMPIVFLLLLLVALPESPRFLARRPKRWPELTRMLERMHRSVAADTGFIDPADPVSTRQEGFTSVFKAQYRWDTIALWASFFTSLLAIFCTFNWLPTMLVTAGLSSRTASEGLTAWNIGGVFGAVLCALVIGRLGSRGPMLACCAGAAISVLFVREIDLRSHTTLALYGLVADGLFANAVQSTMFALAAFVYPTSIRATGTSSAVAFGRLGAVISAFAGAAAITYAGASGYLLLLAGLMTLALIFLALVRHHIPAVKGGRVVLNVGH
jgi:MFS transporter, AAHS family, 4-hydroxybenzoate transporter